MSDLIQQLRAAHQDLKLAGRPPNAILYLPEKQLTCLLSILRAEQKNITRLSSEEWSNLLTALSPHGLQPFLYWQIRLLPPALQPPPEIIDRLRSAFLLSGVNSLQAGRQIAEIQKAFQSRGVGLLVLKGPAVGKLVYPDPALRQYNDLDLLVFPAQMRPAREVLVSLGYACRERVFDSFRDFRTEEYFQSAVKKRLFVELHWDIHAFFALKKNNGLEELFSRAVQVDGFATLQPIDALINAAIHLALVHNDGISLKWVLDFAFLARFLAAPADWRDLQQKSVEWNGRLAAEKALKMAGLWFKVKLPPQFADFAGWPAPSRAEVKGYRDAIGRHKSLLKQLRVKQALSPQAVWRYMFPPPELMGVKHSWQLPCAYLQRWLRWLKH